MPDDTLVQPRSLVTDLAALQNGQWELSGYLDGIRQRIDDADPVVRAFVSEPGRRRRLARADVVAGALSGIPVGVKDIIQVNGLPTHAGSALPPERLAGPQAAVVDRLLAAGALVAGKTVTAEFAVAAPGPTANPHDLRRTPGGSSSGSAAAVASGMVPLSLGTQTVGSVIRPAAFCGIVGFKPTHGRVPCDGVIPNASTLDTVGWFTSDVDGAMITAQVLCDGWQPSQVGGHPPIVGVPAGLHLQQAEPAALDAFAGQLARLRAHGLTVREVPMWTDFEQVMQQLFVVNRYELAQTHHDWFDEFSHLYREQTSMAIKQGLAIGHHDYVLALRYRTSFIAKLRENTEALGVDVWVSPAATGPAPVGLDNTGSAIMSVPYSFAGLPVISIPAGELGGMPLGLQVAALPGQDEALLGWAAQLARVLAAGDPVGLTPP